MGHSISEVVSIGDFPIRTLHECTVKIRNPVKHQISDITADQQGLKRIFQRDSATLLQIAADFNVGPSTSVSVWTIQQNIIKMGFWSQRIICVPLLTARHKALCLAWACQHRNWTVDDWKHVAWSQESCFQLHWVDGHVRGMETISWIHGLCMSAGKCSSWYWLCNGMRRVQLECYGTHDTSRHNSDRWHIRKHLNWSPGSIHVHCAFQWTWAISAGQWDTPHIHNCYWEASGTLFWV